MKKISFCFILLLILIISSKAYCIESVEHNSSTSNQKSNFSVEIQTSYNNEKRNYCVIDESGKLNSLLEWQSDYLFKLGVVGNLKIGMLEILSSVAFPLPLNCGKMYDSDWRTAGIKTNFSESDLFTDFGFDAVFGFKYNLKAHINNFNLLISPVIAVSNSFISLKAKNTIGWCGDTNHTHLEKNYPWNSEYAKKVKKYGIDFKNNITSVLCGVEVSKQFNSFWANIGVLSSPYTYILSVDHHLNKEEGYFYQLIQKAYFLFWDFYTTAGYSINKKNMLLLSINYSFCPEINGDFYYGWYKIENIIADETSSFSYKSFSFCLSWKINI